MSRPSRRAVAALAIAVLTAATVSLPVAQANPVPDASVQVPWDQVGDGWTLATWNPVRGRRPGSALPLTRRRPRRPPTHCSSSTRRGADTPSPRSRPTTRGGSHVWWIGRAMADAH